MKPILLDLFCKAGGATVGYQRAGFEVIGVDIDPQPNYPGGGFVQGDAIEYLNRMLSDSWLWTGAGAIVAVHASPPCQLHSTLKTVLTRRYDDLLTPTREALMALGLPYVIENVVGAPLINPIRLCGTRLGCVDDGAELRRHRLFETNWPIAASPGCDHRRDRRALGVYGHLTNHDRPNRPLAGDGSHHGWKAGKAHARQLMGVNWKVTDHELGEAIPPAYTEWVGRQLMEAIR